MSGGQRSSAPVLLVRGVVADKGAVTVAEAGAVIAIRVEPGPSMNGVIMLTREQAGQLRDDIQFLLDRRSVAVADAGK